MQNKKAKIKRIQSLYHTYMERQKINQLNNNIFAIQNSLRIINARKMLQQRKNLLTLLSLSLRIILY